MVGGTAGGVPTRSPWLDQLAPDGPLHPLERDLETDVVVVGAGIAGVATSWFLHEQRQRVVLLERDRVGRGGTGHNAGQLVSYFERPLTSLVEEYGLEMATGAQADVEGAWDLLEHLLEAAGVSAPVQRVMGTMGMWTLHHVVTHARNNQLRHRAGLPQDDIAVSEEAPFLADLPGDLIDHFRLVPQAEIRRLMSRADDRYWAVLVSRKGCANSALIAQQVLASLRALPADRFTYADGTPVTRVVLTDRAEVHACGYVVRAAHVVLCTNGYRGVVIENRAGEAIDADQLHEIQGDVGYMAGFLTRPEHEPAVAATSFIRNERVGGEVPYVYSTVRPFELDGERQQLSCVGGPEELLANSHHYDASAPFPLGILEQFDGEVREIAFPERSAGAGYDYLWHGLMAYTRGQVRLVGREPRNPVLLYNLGCNGVGLLPGIFGADRVARLVAGERFPPHLFDPR